MDNRLLEAFGMFTDEELEMLTCISSQYISPVFEDDKNLQEKLMSHIDKIIEERKL